MEREGENTYIFLDESGKPEVFSAKGKNLVELGFATKFLVIAVVRAGDQLKIQQEITEFKGKLLREEKLKKLFSPAYTLDTFHANNDYPEIKNRFYDFINELDIKLDIIVVEKLKCFSSLQRDPGRLYGIMAGQLLKNLCHQTEKTEIIFSRKDTKLKLHEELEREVERIRLEYIEAHTNLNAQVTLTYRHNPHYTHGGLQVADYVAHAVFQVFERANREYYEIIKEKIGKIQDICNKKYYTRSNPL